MVKGNEPASDLIKVFQNKQTSPEAIDLLSQLLRYTPNTRITPVDALVHPFFDELRLSETVLPNGKKLPVLFDFTTQGKETNNL
jgi:glycogen synthase kinase 3 beta